MLKKPDPGLHANAFFAEPTPLGLIGLAIGCAALTPIALGQSLIDPADAKRRENTFLQMAVYIGSALGLLVTTSLLGVRRHLRGGWYTGEPLAAGHGVAHDHAQHVRLAADAGNLAAVAARCRGGSASIAAGASHDADIAIRCGERNGRILTSADSAASFPATE